MPKVIFPPAFVLPVATVPFNVDPQEESVGTPLVFNRCVGVEISLAAVRAPARLNEAATVGELLELLKAGIVSHSKFPFV